MATNNAVNTSLSGQSGTGSFVGTGSPTLVTPNIGVSTAQSITFSTSTGIVGVTSGATSAAGSVGEVISSVISSGSAALLTTTVAQNVTSITLSAGDWDVYGNVYFILGAPITSLSISGWISTTSATAPDVSLISQLNLQATAINNSGFVVPNLIFNVSTSTIVYISAVATYGSSTVSVCGGIRARRRH